jgi:hypothetical protein
MMDLVYFGYEWEVESKELEKEFMKNVETAFPQVKLVDAYDSIKGYRREVFLEDSMKQEYYAWLIGDGWMEASLTLQLLMRDESTKEEFEKIWKLAKTKYPEAFKPEN